MRPLTFVLLLAGCSSDLHKYDNGLFELAAGFNAKEACSCVFVSEQTEDKCDLWTTVSPDVAGFVLDREAGTVTSKALGGSKTIARFVDEQQGCVVDPRQ